MYDHRTWVCVYSKMHYRVWTLTNNNSKSKPQNIKKKTHNTQRCIDLFFFFTWRRPCQGRRFILFLLIFFFFCFLPFVLYDDCFSFSSIFCCCSVRLRSSLSLFVECGLMLHSLQFFFSLLHLCSAMNFFFCFILKTLHYFLIVC